MIFLKFPLLFGNIHEKGFGVNFLTGSTVRVLTGRQSSVLLRCCCVVWGPGPWGEPASSSQARSGHREQHGSVWSVCACHRSRASLVPSVSPLHCHLVPPGMTSNTAMQEHGQSGTCGFHLLAPVWKVAAHLTWKLWNRRRHGKPWRNSWEISSCSEIRFSSS